MRSHLSRVAALVLVLGLGLVGLVVWSPGYPLPPASGRHTGPGRAPVVSRASPAGLIPGGRATGAWNARLEERARRALAPALSAAPGAPPGVLGMVDRGTATFFSAEGVTISLAGPRMGEEPGSLRGWALRWSVEGGRAVAPEGADPLPGVWSFFLGADPAGWRTGVPRHGAAVFRGVRPGLDVKGIPGESGARLQVSATAEALRDTWFRWEGQRTASLEGDRLTLWTPDGLVTQSLDGPVRIAETRPLPGGGIAYRVEPAGFIPIETGGFTVGLSWSGYVPTALTAGGGVNEIHLAPDGSLAVVGETVYPSFPASVGDTVLNGQDAYVIKVGPEGTLIWGTLLGGNGTEYGEDLAFDGSGNLYVIGRTLSTSFPTVNPLYPSKSGLGDAFVASLSPAGLVRWATYLGGNNEDFGLAIGVAPSTGNVWVTGMTGSTDFPLANAFISSNPNTTCFTSCYVFISALGGTGSALLFSSYLGASGGTTETYDLAFDPAGNVYIAGNTTTPNIYFTSLPPPLQTGFGGARDGFLFGLTAGGPFPVPRYFSYLGGSATDIIGSLAIDGAGAIYLTGKSSSPDFPRVGGLGNPPAGLDDAFITKLTPGPTSIEWSSLLGGADYDEGRNVVLGPGGASHLVGRTRSTSISGMTGTLSGTQDAFVARVSADGTTLDWGAYLGGSDVEDGRAIDVDARGNVYVGGATQSADFPRNALHNRTTGVDGFLGKLDTTAPDGGVVSDGLSGADVDTQTNGGGLSATWNGFGDPDTPLDGYQWALGTAPGAEDVMAFTDAGLASQATRSGLGLLDGTTYYATVRAISSAGLSTSAASDGVLVDASPPPAGSVRDGTSTTQDRAYQRSSAPIAATWDPMADPHSFPTTYEWAIGTDAGTTDVQAYTSAGTGLAATASPPLQHGIRYHVAVRATNGTGLSTVASSDGVLVDDTAPLAGTVLDGPGADLATQPRTAPLEANWSGFADLESGVEHYEWALGTSPGATDVLVFSGVSLATSASAGAAVVPQAGTTYFVTVRAFNGAGDFAQVSSDGVRVLGTLGDPCNGGGECTSGQCQSSVCCATACDTCHACNLAGSVGICAPVQDGSSCSNGVFCDGDDTCQAGTCQAGTPPVCTQPVDGEYLACRVPPDSCVPVPHGPAINSTPPLTALTGRPYRYQLLVLGSRPLTFSLCAGPPGAAIDGAGLLSWTPPVDGPVNFCVRVANAQGADTQSFAVTVTYVPPSFGEVGLGLLADGGTPRLGALQRIDAQVTSSIAVELRDLFLVMTTSGLALDPADGGPAGACDAGTILAVAPVPAGGTVTVPVLAYVCREPGPEAAHLVGHLERGDGTRLTDDVVLSLDVELDKIPVGCACSAAPGALGVVALLWLLLGRRARRRGD